MQKKRQPKPSPEMAEPQTPMQEYAGALPDKERAATLSRAIEEHLRGDEPTWMIADELLRFRTSVLEATEQVNAKFATIETYFDSLPKTEAGALAEHIEEFATILETLGDTSRKTIDVLCELTGAQGKLIESIGKHNADLASDCEKKMGEAEKRMNETAARAGDAMQRAAAAIKPAKQLTIREQLILHGATFVSVLAVIVLLVLLRR